MCSGGRVGSVQSGSSRVWSVHSSMVDANVGSVRSIRSVRIGLFGLFEYVRCDYVLCATLSDLWVKWGNTTNKHNKAHITTQVEC